VYTDECGAPEKIGGFKLVPLASTDGKITVDSIQAELGVMGVEHHSQPRIVSLTQATEIGTVYGRDELAEICSFCHRNELLVHVDGARIANAVVSTGAQPRELIADAGVDVLSFGASKNGIMFGEAVVFLDPSVAAGVKYRRKQQMQLASKMRFIAAQFSAWLSDNLWLELAAHANAMAERLAQRLARLSQVELVAPVEANGVFARVPAAIIEPLQTKHYFYVWDEASSVVRWMMSFDTTQSDVDGFADAIEQELKNN
jgi:threonine aldolase